jgi:hypothetical protein
MSQSKNKCCYSNNCLHFLKRAVPLCSSLFHYTADYSRKKVYRIGPESNKELLSHFWPSSLPIV